MPNYPYTFQLPPLNVQDIPNDGVAGEFLGINGSGVLDWLTAGGGGTGDMLKADNLSGLASYPTARTNLGLGTGDSPTFANLTLTSPSLVSSAPVTISQTWNAVGQTFKALVVNAAGTSDANSASGSLLLDLQVGGVSKAWVTKQGGYRASNGQFVSGNGIGFAGGLNTGFYSVAGEQIFVAANNAVPIEFKSTSIVVNSTATFGFGQVGVGADTILLRDGAANTLALRNGAAAQTFNVYGTYTSGTVYERMFMRYNGTDLAFQVGAETLGATARPLQLWTGGASRLHVSTAGNVGIGTTAPGAKLDVYLNPANNFATEKIAFGNGITFANFNTGALTGFWLTNTGTPVAPNATNYSLLSNGSATILNTGADLYFGVNGSYKAIINSSGNVGIGTTAPGAKLTVISPFNNYPTDVNPVLSLRQPTDNTFGFDWIQDGSGTGNLNLHRVNSSVSTHVLTVSRTTGNVGIGTTSPSSKLHVAGDVTLPNAGSIFFGGGFNIYGTTTATTINGPTTFGQVGVSVNGVTKWVFNYDGLLCGGGTTAAFPALKRSSTTLQSRLADDTAFAPIQGKLTTDTAFTATTVTPTGFITLYDSTGTAYKVPCVPA